MGRTHPNYGWLLYQDLVSNDLAEFASRENGTFAGPVLELSYETVDHQPIEGTTDVTLDDNGMLCFQSSNGVEYVLQCSTNPNPVVPTTSDWANVGYTVIGDGSVLYAFDPSGIDTQKTYRMITP